MMAPIRGATTLKVLLLVRGVIWPSARVEGGFRPHELVWGSALNPLNPKP